MKRVTALTLVMTAAFFRGVTAASAEAGEAGGGPSQRWDCVAFAADDHIYVVNLDGTGLTRLTAGPPPRFSNARSRRPKVYDNPKAPAKTSFRIPEPPLSNRTRR